MRRGFIGMGFIGAALLAAAAAPIVTKPRRRASPEPYDTVQGPETRQQRRRRERQQRKAKAHGVPHLRSD
jgi:hypothetical protein